MEIVVIPSLFQSPERQAQQANRNNPSPRASLPQAAQDAFERGRQPAGLPQLPGLVDAGRAQPMVGSSDRFVEQYIYFIASIEMAAGNANSEEFSRRVSELRRQVMGSDAETTNPESPSALNASIEFASSSSVQFSMASDAFNFSLSAQVSVRAKISFGDDTFSAEFSVRVDASIAIQLSNAGEQTDPLILDLDGDGTFSLTKTPVNFDINGDGVKDQINFATGADVFLALDRNGNGIIDDGRELFGDQHGAANGFEELARFDDNKDGVIDQRDQVFSLLWGVRFVNGAFEQYTLAELGVKSISLNYNDTNYALGVNTIAQVGSFIRSDGEHGLAADLLLYHHGKPLIQTTA